MKIKMSEEWGILYRRITVLKDHRSLSRLLRWLSTKEINPNQVCSETLERYRRENDEQTLRISGKDKWLDAARAWNRCVRGIDG